MYVQVFALFICKGYVIGERLSVLGGLPVSVDGILT